MFVSLSDIFLHFLIVLINWFIRKEVSSFKKDGYPLLPEINMKHAKGLWRVGKVNLFVCSVSSCFVSKKSKASKYVLLKNEILRRYRKKATLQALELSRGMRLSVSMALV